MKTEKLNLHSNLKKGDVLEIEADTDSGINFINDSRYDIPIKLEVQSKRVYLQI